MREVGGRAGGANSKGLVFAPRVIYSRPLSEHVASILAQNESTSIYKGLS